MNSCSSVSTTSTRAQFSQGTKLKPLDQFCQKSCSTSLSFSPNRSVNCTSKRLVVQAAHRDGGGGSGSSGLFVGGFVLGGLVVGALGCVYAPQISQTLTGPNKKELMKNLPKFIFDEEKSLEKTRKALGEKIAQLNSTIDGISAQFRSEDSSPNGVPGDADEVEEPPYEEVTQ